jgi:hypothetical protein
VLIPASLGGLALICAGTAWLLGDGDAILLRLLVAMAAVCAAVCAVLLRQWDLEAGRQVARERAARAGMTWQIEERQAELEAELEEAQEQIVALEEKIQGKRIDLGRLRSAHAALLRRYATAESERAKALEGRRQLALEAAVPAKALPAHPADHRTARGAPTALTYRQAQEALSRLALSAARQRAAREAEPRQRSRPAPAVAPPPRRSGGSGGFDFFGAASPRRAEGPPREGPASEAGRQEAGEQEAGEQEAGEQEVRARVPGSREASGRG